jgi:glycosyltransferase involved in cell wall biosynthesis
VRIGIDCTFRARPVTGIERYAEAIHKAMHAHISDQVLVDIEPCPYLHATRGLLGAGARVINEYMYVPIVSSAADVDIMFFPAFPPSGLMRKRFAMVLYDSVPWYYPQTMSWMGRVYLAPSIRRAATRATLLFTISRTVEHEVKAILGPTAPIVYIGAGTSAPERPTESEVANSLKRHGIRQPFLLAVGSIEPRKNIPALLRAFSELRRRYTIQLVIVGRFAWGLEEVVKTCAGNAEEDVRFVGYAGESDLRAFYSAATVFLQPSLYEGLGLTVLEAMSYGVPVIANDIPIFREIGEGAIRLVDFGDATQACEMILGLVNNRDERARLSVLGHQNAYRFRWDQVARRTLEALATVS